MPVNHVVSQPIHPVVEKLFISMQSLSDPTLVLGSGLSFNYIFSVSITIPYEQRGNPLSSSMLPPSPQSVSFD